jgi:hypothetical protein
MLEACGKVAPNGTTSCSKFVYHGFNVGVGESYQCENEYGITWCGAHDTWSCYPHQIVGDAVGPENVLVTCSKNPKEHYWGTICLNPLPVGAPKKDVPLWETILLGNIEALTDELRIANIAIAQLTMRVESLEWGHRGD